MEFLSSGELEAVLPASSGHNEPEFRQEIFSSSGDISTSRNPTLPEACYGPQLLLIPSLQCSTIKAADRSELGLRKGGPRLSIPDPFILNLGVGRGGRGQGWAADSGCDRPLPQLGVIPASAGRESYLLRPPPSPPFSEEFVLAFPEQ